MCCAKAQRERLTSLGPKLMGALPVVMTLGWSDWDALAPRIQRGRLYTRGTSGVLDTRDSETSNRSLVIRKCHYSSFLKACSGPIRCCIEERPCWSREQ